MRDLERVARFRYCARLVSSSAGLQRVYQQWGARQEARAAAELAAHQTAGQPLDEWAAEQSLLAGLYGQALRDGRAALEDVYVARVDASVGWGVFARRPLRPGLLLAEYSGLLVRARPCAAGSYQCAYPAPPYPLRWQALVDAGPHGGIGRFVNHAPGPHASLAWAELLLDGLPRVLLVVSRPLPVHHQLLVDYGPAYWARRGAPQPLHLSAQPQLQPRSHQS